MTYILIGSSDKTVTLSILGRALNCPEMLVIFPAAKDSHAASWQPGCWKHNSLVWRRRWIGCDKVFVVAITVVEEMI